MSELPLASLEKSHSNEVTAQHMLGFTNTSWLDAYRKHGPVFNIDYEGREQTIICGHEADLDAWRQPDAWNYTDTGSGTFFRNEMGGQHLTQLSGDAHRRSRKLILPAFGIKALMRDFPAMLAATKSGLTASGEIDLFKLANFAFAKALSVSQLKSGADDEALHQLAEFEDWFIAGLRVPPPEQIRFHNEPSYLAIKRSAFELFERVVAESLAGKSEDDSLDLLINRKPTADHAPLEQHELVTAAYFLSIAGVGNIGNSLCASVWFLSQHPEWLEQLREELIAQPISSMAEGLGSFPIMKAIITEVERCYPPAPAIEKIATRDVDILGVKIAKDVPVLHLHGVAHFDAALYDQPFEFNPKRWLEGNPEKPHSFGGGKHMCLGMGVSRVLMPIALGILSTDYEIVATTAPVSVPVSSEIESSPPTTRFDVRMSPYES